MSSEWFNPRLLYEEYAERMATRTNIPDVLEDSFELQRQFIRDEARQKALFCTRRSSKSFSGGLLLEDTALRYPGCNVLFIGLTRASAKAIIWKDIIQIIDRKYGLKGRPNQADLTMTLPNGSLIAITGIDADENEMKKLLGRKYKLVVIDEASMYTIDLRNLVYGILGPAVVDEDGTIVLLGTASDFPRGLFYDITTGRERGWKLYEWSAFDNPYVAKQWASAIEKIRTERPEYMETPQYKQWFLNQWVIDDQKLVYRFSMEKNLIKALPMLPHGGWTYVLGVDTGWEDDSAFVLTAYHEHDPHLYIISIFKQKKMTFDDVANKIQDFMKSGQMAPHKIVIDGANKQGVESMRVRSNIPFEYADKQDKITFIELCNSDLIQGRIKIIDTADNRPLWQEMSSLVWVSDGDKIRYPKKEHPSLPNHLCFTAGTKIQTPKGQVPIEDLRIGDKVETRFGPRRVKNTIKRKTDVIKLQMSDGSSVICTVDHPFWSKDKWIKAQYLTRMDPLFTWNQLQSLNGSSLEAADITDLLNLDISVQFQKVSPYDCIKRYIDSTLEKFPKSITFITRITIRSITALKTLNAFLQKSIKPLICVKDQFPRKIWKDLKGSDHSLWPGIDPMLEELGIVTTGRKPLHSLMQVAHGATQFIPNRICTKISKDVAQENVFQQNVEPAESIISDLSVHGVNQNSSQTNIPKGNVVVCVAQALLKQKEYVYNLTIEDDHEYFANGFLVANCDAFLYSWRCGWHYASSAQPKKTVVGSREWYSQQSEDIWERERDRLQPQNEWGEMGTLGDLV